MRWNRAHPVSRFTLLFPSLAVASLLFAGPAIADDVPYSPIYWNNPAGGSWMVASNWNPPNVPNQYGEVPIFRDLGTPYTVTLNQHLMVWGLEVAANGPALRLDGSILMVHGFTHNYGSIRIENAGCLAAVWPLVVNRGSIISGVGGGSLQTDITPGTLGSINNSYGGKFVVDGGDLTLSCGLILDGVVERIGNDHAIHVRNAHPQNLVITQGAEVVVDDIMTITSNETSLYNFGVVRVRGVFSFGSGEGHPIYLTGDGEIVLEGGRIQTPLNGNLVNNTGHTIRGCGSLGTLVNHGAVDLDCAGGVITGGPQLTNDGSIRVGSGVYRVGDFTQLPGGTLELAVAGPTQVAQLQATGAATVDGVIEASPVGGFLPVPGNQYDVLSYGSLAGAFSGVVLNDGGGLDVTPVYGAAELSLEVNGTTGVNPGDVPSALRFRGRGVASGASFVLDLPREAELTVRAYDLRGREVARLAEGMRPAGVHTFPLGSTSLPSGLYFARAEVRSPDGIETVTARVALTR